jgi:hypothetical protein
LVEHQNSNLSNERTGTYVIAGTETASGKPKPKVFCGNCGCTLYTVPAKWNGKRIVVRTSLLEMTVEQAELLQPHEEWFVKNRAKWLSPIEGARQVQSGRLAAID